MSEYITEAVSLTDGQYKKLRAAYNKGEGATIELPSIQLAGSHKVFLTGKQFKNLQKARLKRKGIRLKFSKTQLVDISKQYGGFLPAGLIAAAVPAGIALAKTVGAAGALKLGADAAADVVKWGVRKITGKGIRKPIKITPKKVLGAGGMIRHGTQFY